MYIMSNEMTETLKILFFKMLNKINPIINARNRNSGNKKFVNIEDPSELKKFNIFGIPLIIPELIIIKIIPDMIRTLIRLR